MELGGERVSEQTACELGVQTFLERGKYQKVCGLHNPGAYVWETSQKSSFVAVTAALVDHGRRGAIPAQEHPLAPLCLWVVCAVCHTEVRFVVSIAALISPSFLDLHLFSFLSFTSHATGHVGS